MELRLTRRCKFYARAQADNIDGRVRIHARGGSFSRKYAALRGDAERNLWISGFLRNWWQRGISLAKCNIQVLRSPRDISLRPNRKTWREISTRSPREAREQRKLITSVADWCGLMSTEIMAAGCCDSSVEDPQARRVDRRKKIILLIARALQPFFKNAKKLSSSEKKRKRRLLHRSARRAYRVIS